MLYSTSGITLDDFKSTGKKFEATTGEWKEYTVDLPAGATYFAIHNNTADTYMFMIDDVTYTAGCGKVLGYNVYRDGKLLKRSFTCEPPSFRSRCRSRERCRRAI